MSELPKDEEEAVENVRLAIQAWRDWQAANDPDEWGQSGTVDDFVVIANSQGITPDGGYFNSTSYFTRSEQPRYRTLGLMAMADEMVDDAYRE